MKEEIRKKTEAGSKKKQQIIDKTEDNNIVRQER
jgi:hypothetical protein